MTDDAELLRRYSGNRDEDAFAEIVGRHLGLVYHAALRQCGGDAHRAEDVAQMVFTDLARKAAKLARRPVLAGWLYTSTRYAAAQAVRTEARRQAREQEAHAMNELSSQPNISSEPAAEWERLRPVIDDALHALGERDREAVLLRFFEGRPFAEVGAKLAVSEDAARMRVERALEKLRAALVRRGVTSTATALGMALAHQAGVAAPTGLLSVVTGAALAGVGATTAGGGAAAMATFMSMTKLQIGVTAAFVVAGTAGLTVQSRNNAALRDELAGLQQQNQVTAMLEAENLRLAKSAAEVAELRNDDAELLRLRDEAAALKSQMQAAAQAERIRQREIVRAQAAVAARSAAGEGATGLPPFNPAGPDRMPVARIQVPPQYPFEMRRDRISGEVVVDFIVDHDGNVQNVRATKSTRKEFEAAAIEAVSKWKFDPGVKGERAVATHFQKPITFSIPPTDAAPGWF